MDRQTDGWVDELPGVGSQLLLEHGGLPPQHDGFVVVLVSLSDDDVPLLVQVLHVLREVGLDQADHGLLLGVEGLQGLNLACTVRQ